MTLNRSGSQDQAAKYSTRLARLAATLQDAGLYALALNPGPSLAYMTGLSFHLMERPVVAIFSPHSSPVIVLPELEAGKTQGLPFEMQVFPYGEDPAGWHLAFRQAVEAAQLDGQRVGVEPVRLRFLELQFLQSAAETAVFVSAEESLAELRLRKEETEIAAMQRAADIAQRALQAALPLVKAGMTERELASELTLQILRAGSDPEMPFHPIVSSGPNGANPHAVPSLRPLQAGDLLVIDWGASSEGYFSDITRTFAIGDVDEESARIHQIVQQANAAGREAVRPGITAGEVDQAARRVIEVAGLGQYFIHRTGHGLGMESHEHPYIRSGNLMPLEPGMTFTIEPGIYLPGRNGVRIEDDVVVTEEGVQCLTSMPREMITLGI